MNSTNGNHPPTIKNNHMDTNMHAIIRQEYKILSEYKMIQSENIPGVYVIPSYKSSFVWFGVIFVRKGLYTDGIFRFSIALPDRFPSDLEVPTIIFDTAIPHPLICPYTKRLDASAAFDVWTEGETHLWQLLKFVQYAFEFAHSTARGKLTNESAADLMLNDPGEFAVQVKECVRVVRDQIYDIPATDDRHYFTFERFDKDVHGATLESIRNQSDSSLSPPASGVSWLL